jgi:hypothetical protein
VALHVMLVGRRLRHGRWLLGAKAWCHMPLVTPSAWMRTRICTTDIHALTRNRLVQTHKSLAMHLDTVWCGRNHVVALHVMLVGRRLRHGRWLLIEMHGNAARYPQRVDENPDMYDGYSRINEEQVSSLFGVGGIMLWPCM